MATVCWRPDFAKTVAQLAWVKGWRLLAINDTPRVRDAFAGSDQEKVGLSYSVTWAAATKGSELNISNNLENSARLL